MSIISVDQISARLSGAAVTVSDARLDVGSNVKLDGGTGVITATTFSGSATGLSGNVSAAGVLSLTNTTTSTSTSTGALIVSGGVGIAKSLFVGENVSVGGTLTYEDVTNIDSVGMVTARTGIKVLAGGANIVGVVTATSSIDVGTAVTATTVGTTGIITAAQFVPTVGQFGHRNIVINGAMRIKQRSDAYGANTNTGIGYSTVDRFKTAVSGTDEAITQESHTLTASDTGPWGEGFRNSFKLTNGNQTGGAGAADYVEIQYKVEAQDIANSGWYYTSTSSYVTLSFWVISSVAQNFYGYLYTSDGTTRAYAFETGSLTADTWKKVEVTIPGSSSPALQFDDDTGDGLVIRWIPFYGTDKTNNSRSLNSWASYNGTQRTPDYTTTWWTTNDSTFEITGVQLEVGAASTPFEHLSYQNDLARCQRYYYNLTGGTGVVGMAAQKSATQIIGTMEYPVPLRTAAPTLEPSGDFQLRIDCGGELKSSSSGTFTISNGETERLGYKMTGFTDIAAGTAFLCKPNAGNLGFNAEL